MDNETYDRNIDADDLLGIWEWCSRRLHVKWQRKRKLRNGCFIGMAVALSDETSIPPLKLLKEYKNLPKPLLDKEKVLTFWQVQPVSLLELGLGSYTKTSPLTKPLNRLRSAHQDCPTLDELAKKMRSREKRFGDDWYAEGHHPDREFRLLKKEMRPLREQLRDFFAKEHAIVERLAVEVLAKGWQFGDVPASSQVRKTPDKLLNRATRLKLWQAAQEIISRNLDEEEELAALWDTLNRKITPSIKACIKSQDYQVHEVVYDFLSFDMHKSREEITS
jgi:hypothetical protein